MERFANWLESKVKKYNVLLFIFNAIFIFLLSYLYKDVCNRSIPVFLLLFLMIATICGTVYAYIIDIKDREELNELWEKAITEYEEYYNTDRNLKFIWGIKSGDDLSKSEPNLRTLNDIDIVYLTDNDTYILGVEQIYYFETKEREEAYYNRLLDYFTKYMNDCLYITEIPYDKEINKESIYQEFDTIEEMYHVFKVWVTNKMYL